jgi:NADH-quinone oxidoreductase subunit C
MFLDLAKQEFYIKENFKQTSLQTSITNDNLIIICPVEKIINFLTFLKQDTALSFKTLVDLFASDMLYLKEIRFEVIYNLLSYKLNSRITVKVCLESTQIKVPTAINIFSSAGWYEREVFDMYGIYFENHPDLRRILTDYNFVGHPLQKDFPLTGYQEVRYDEELQQVVYEPVKLTQEFRNFDFDMPWYGPKNNNKNSDQ